MRAGKLWKPALGSLAPALCLCLLSGRQRGMLVLCSDTLAVAGLLCLILGLWRLSRRLGLFDGLAYSFEKMREAARDKDYSPRTSTLGQRPEYSLEHPYEKRWQEPLAAAMMWIALSLALAI